MMGILIFIHVVVAILLIIAVLLQSGKSGDLASAFGLMGSQTVFGPRGATTLLHKITTALAIIFMLTSLSIYLFQSRTSGSVLKDVKSKKPPITDTSKKK